MSSSRVPSAGIVLLLAALTPLLAGCNPSNSATAEAEPSEPEVSIVTATPQARAIVSELPGRIAPTRVAEVRPRVSGIVVERAFHQGGEVKAGDTLYRALLKFGLATGEYRADPADSLTLRRVRIVNGVHCVPPENKPTPAEIRTCRRYMTAAFAIHREVRAFLVLGRIAHDQLLSTLGERRAAFPFSHGAEHVLSDGRRLFDSYHCSRYNTNTGVLTEAMFDEVVGRAAAFIGA